MDIVVNEELKAYIDPLTPDEHAALERSILAEGCRDALVLWGNVLVDGHNRYGICQKHGLPFNTVQNTHFQSMEDVYLWMIDQHLGRRSVSDFQRGVLALRKREILEHRKLEKAHPVAAAPSPEGEAAAVANADEAFSPVDAAELEKVATREAIAKAARLSSSQVAQIEKIQKSAAPELVEALKAGDISINAAAVVATLPREEQQAAAQGGKDELKQVVKRVREAKRKPKEDKPEGAAEPAPSAAHGAEAVDAALDKAQQQISDLRARVQELETENAQLRLQLAAVASSDLPVPDESPF
ncbi:plasmid replication/partition related protein [Comamonas odontotermitis]|uniref:plasmid replication/partition related protein n=1 Tax=Comamonas odontotermitis TaxID=379895 RepID=UPI00375198C7